MPFVSGLLGEYPYLSLGVVTYSAEVAGIGFSLAALWWHASRRHRLIDVDADPAAIRTENIRALAAPIMFLIAIPFGLLRPWLGIVVWWLSPLAVIGATRWLMRKA
jgi:uncharacterized membrane protein